MKDGVAWGLLWGLYKDVKRITSRIPRFIFIPGKPRNGQKNSDTVKPLEGRQPLRAKEGRDLVSSCPTKKRNPNRNL